jgi:hypothetical protein
MLWVVRGTSKANEDISVVIEAATEAEAQYMAARRGIPVIVVEPATSADIGQARNEGRLWTYSAEPHYRCLGRPVSKLSLACLMVCGVLTGLACLRANGVHIPVKPIQKIAQMMH